MFIRILCLSLILSSHLFAATSNMRELFVGDHLFLVEIVCDEKKAQKGLAGRPILQSGQGMYFPYKEKVRSYFWMKGMLFSIDFIWIRDGKVVEITKEVPFPGEGEMDGQLSRYTSKERVDAVLEIAAGETERLRIKPGDSVRFAK